MSTPSDWAEPEIDFKRLDDLPPGAPHTQAAIMDAMRMLHKLVHAQAKAYGGKNSKLLQAGIAEGSLLRQVAGCQLNEDYSVRDSLDAAYMCCNRLQRHLGKVGDNESLTMLLEIIKHINLAIAKT